MLPQVDDNDDEDVCRMVKKKIIVCVLVHDNNEGLIFMSKNSTTKKTFLEARYSSSDVFFPFVKPHTRVRIEIG